MPSEIQSFGATRDKSLELMEKYSALDRWILTDRPMYAFRSGLLMPPETAAITGKRYLTGNLTEDELIQEILDYKPGQVFLGRNEYLAVYSFLENNYTLISDEDKAAPHWLRNDLVR